MTQVQNALSYAGQKLGHYLREEWSIGGQAR